MKSTLIFLILIAFAVCEITDEKREEIRKRRREHDKYLAECLLKNDTISEELRKKLKESSDDDIRKALHPARGERMLDKNERDAIRKCRREYMDIMREKHREEREKMREKHREEIERNRRSQNENL